MADSILNDLLQAYKDKIETLLQPGQALDFLNSCAVIQSPSILLPDFSIPLPTCLIYCSYEEINYIYICTDAREKVMDISLTVVKEGINQQGGILDNYNENGIIDMGKSLEDTFDEEDFDLTDMVMIESVSPAKLRIPPFLNEEVNMFTITFRHQYFQGVS
jgi:hypothetical protein